MGGWHHGEQPEMLVDNVVRVTVNVFVVIREVKMENIWWKGTVSRHVKGAPELGTKILPLDYISSQKWATLERISCVAHCRHGITSKGSGERFNLVADVISKSLRLGMSSVKAMSLGFWIPGNKVDGASL